MPTKPRDYSLSYLGLADSDYVAARLLLLSGLPFPGMAKALEALEKQLKLYFLLKEKLEAGRHLTPDDLKARRHGLRKMVKDFNDAAPLACQISSAWDPLLKTLEKAYKRRYPEDWNEWEVEFDLSQFDELYSFLRGLNAANFEPQEQSRAAQLGTFLGDYWRLANVDQLIRDRGLMPPMDVVRLNNEYFDSLGVDEQRLAPDKSK